MNVRSFGSENRPTATPIPSQTKLYPYIKYEKETIESIEVITPGTAMSTPQYGYPQPHMYAPRPPQQPQQQQQQQQRPIQQHQNNRNFNPYGGYGYVNNAGPPGAYQMFAHPQMNPQWGAYYAQQQRQQQQWMAANAARTGGYPGTFNVPRGTPTTKSTPSTANRAAWPSGRPPSSTNITTNQATTTKSSVMPSSTKPSSNTSSSSSGSSVWNKATPSSSTTTTATTRNTNTKPSTTTPTWSKAATTISTNKPSWTQVTASTTTMSKPTSTASSSWNSASTFKSEVLPPQQKINNVKTTSNFDFASSTQKFEGGSLTTNGGVSTGSFAPPSKPAVETKKKFYDKNVSFFDNISCNALDKLEKLKNGGNTRTGRTSRHVQRQATKELNEETFGEEAVSKAQQQNRRNNNGYRGGRSNGRRGGRRQNRRTRADVSKNWRRDK